MEFSVLCADTTDQYALLYASALESGIEMRVGPPRLHGAGRTFDRMFDRMFDRIVDRTFGRMYAVLCTVLHAGTV